MMGEYREIMERMAKWIEELEDISKTRELTEEEQNTLYSLKEDLAFSNALIQAKDFKDDLGL